jgi:penicillin-binding protein activator
MNKGLSCFVCLLAAITISGCATTVKRTEPDKIVDLSGRWNDSDAQMTAEAMLKDCLSRPWADVFNATNKHAPIVIVGTVLNRSSEHINTKVFTDELQRNLLNSGKVRFVADKESRNEIRDERLDQAQNSAAQTVKPNKQETGADFMLQGSINAVKDETRGKYVIYYQINLELVDMTTNEKTWIAQKEIKKIVSKSDYSL